MTVKAQVQRGNVSDKETSQPVYHVTITNLVSSSSVISDALGNFSIAAKKGDSLAFSYIGYHTVVIAAAPDISLFAELTPLNVRLPAYTVHDYTPFQRDSIELTRLYSSELNKKPIKPGFSSANGGGLTGLIGGPIQKLSRSYRQNKRFKKTFQKDLEQKFIDTRYTPKLVNALTGLTGDTLVMFMNTYPMEYMFARHATDLEMKAWIRDNYGDYIRKAATMAAGNKRK